MYKFCFYFVINMSISSSIVILLLLVIRKIKQIPKKYIYAFWFVAFIRMLLPLAMTSSISIFNYISGIIKKQIPVGKLIDSNFTVTNYFNAVLSYKPMEYRTQRYEWVFGISSVIWFTGVCISFISITIFYYIAVRQYKKAIHMRDNVYEDKNALSPILLGIRSPKIILPIGLGMKPTQLAHIIAHERIHMQRKDNLWRIIGLIIVCIHWFNPIAWIGFSFFLKDMELSCDEATVKAYDFANKKEYAKALLSIAENTHNKNIVHTPFGKSNTKTRVLHVLTYRHLSVLGMTISILFLLLTALMFLTNSIE